MILWFALDAERFFEGLRVEEALTDEPEVFEVGEAELLGDPGR